MGQTDVAMKAALQCGEYFADICNMLLFKGEQFVKAEKLTPLDTAEEISIHQKNGKRFSIGRQRDILKEAELAWMEDDRVSYVILGIEHQSAVDYAMPIRNLIYDALQYGMQVQHLGEERKSSPADFLSGIGRTDRLKPVITMVVYTGTEPWEHPSSLRDVLDLEGLPQEMLAYIPDVEMPVLDVRHSQELGLLQTKLKNVFEAAGLHQDGACLKAYIQDPANGFSEIPGLLANVFENLVNMGMPEFPAEKEVNMCEAVEQWAQEERAQGIEQGIEQGRAQGIEQGRVQDVKNIMDSLGLTPQQAMDAMKIPKEEQDKFLTLINKEVPVQVQKQPEIAKKKHRTL